MNHPLNRQPQTLATWDPALYENLWRCAGDRARQSHWKDAGDDYSTAHAMWEMMQSRRKPAFKPALPDGINCDGDSIRYDGLWLNRGKHIAAAMCNDPVSIPDYLSDAIADSEEGWQDRFCAWLKANDDGNADYEAHSLTTGTGESDLLGSIEIDYFTSGCGDQFWAPFWAVIDGNVHDCTDSTIGDCCILDETIGWYVSTLDDEPLPEECRTDRLSAGYSSNPTYELSEALLGDSEPTWHWGFGCFVGRLKSFPHPVKFHPEVPYYGG